MKNKKRVKGDMRLYKQEEIDSMQEILGKQHDNYYFTREELDFVSKIDLFDPYMISVAKEIWKQKDNPKMLKMYLAILEKEGVTMIVITNWWGIFFSFVIPMILWGIGLYYVGVEEGRRKYARINRVQFRKNYNRNSYVKRPNSTEYNRNR